MGPLVLDKALLTGIIFSIPPSTTMPASHTAAYSKQEAPMQQRASDIESSVHHCGGERGVRGSVVQQAGAGGAMCV